MNYKLCKLIKATFLLSNAFTGTIFAKDAFNVPIKFSVYNVLQLTLVNGVSQSLGCLVNGSQLYANL